MLDLVVSPPSTQGAVCWQLQDSVRCSIQSDCSEVLSHARLVFASSAPDWTESADSPDLCWFIERPQRGEHWRALGQPPHTPTIESETLDLLLANIEYSCVQALLSRGTDSFFSLHAAFLSKNDRSVIIVGPKEAGKSTLSCALWTQCGWHLWGDDAVLIDKRNQARPAPRRVSLRYGSRVLLGEKLWNRLLALPATISTANNLLFHPRELDTTLSGQAAPQPSAIFFLARRESKAESAQTVPIAPALAALSLLSYSTFLLPRGEEMLCPARVDWGSSVPRLTQLTSSVSSYDLGRGPLNEMTREIERLVFHANPVSAS